MIRASQVCMGDGEDGLDDEETVGVFAAERNTPRLVIESSRVFRFAGRGCHAGLLHSKNGEMDEKEVQPHPGMSLRVQPKTVLELHASKPKFFFFSVVLENLPFDRGSSRFG